MSAHMPTLKPLRQLADPACCLRWRDISEVTTRTTLHEQFMLSRKIIVQKVRVGQMSTSRRALLSFSTYGTFPLGDDADAIAAIAIKSRVVLS